MVNMKKILALLVLLSQLVAQAQSKTKQVLVEGNGPPVVLLHGDTFDFTNYADHSKLMSDSFTVIRMLQFNVQYANEGWTLPNNYSVKMESKAIGATLDSLHITKPVILVGHSYGGVIAFDFAINHPERIQSLVLVEAPLFDIAKARGEFSEKMKEIDELTKNFTPQAIISEEMIKSFRCKMADCDTFDIHQHPMWPKWLKEKDRLKGLFVVPSYKIDFKKLHAFRKPVLIVTGTTTIEPNKITDKLLSHEFPNAKTAGLPGGHIAIYQNPEIFVEALKVFHRETTATGY
jgi:pimeloyl-ACP methyl ester carboxylesterase